jgi:GPI mannosyltransferase 3
VRERRQWQKGFSLEESHAFRYLWIFLAIALVLRVAVFLLVPSIYWPDEIFQYQEPAHRLAFGIGVVPWEFRLGVRSWALPALIAGIMKCTAWLSAGSAGYIFGICLFFSLLSLTVVWFSYSWCRQYLGMQYALLAGFTTAIWWELILFGPRTFSEVVAGNLFLPAIYLGSLKQDEKPEGKWRLLFIGLLLGLTVSLRVQFGPPVLFVGLWIMSRDWRRRFLPIASGILIAVLIFGFVDAITWSYPFYSYFAYFRENILYHRAAQNGTNPWYFYIRKLSVHTAPMWIFALVGVRRSPILGWICLAVLIPHLLVGHKEYRFIYPVLPLLLTLAAIGLIDSLQFLERKTIFHPSQQVNLLLAAGFVLACSLGLASQYRHWNTARGELRAFNRLSRDEQACGVAIWKLDWMDAGGYTHLHRPIPMFVFRHLDEAVSIAGTFNRVVAPESTSVPIQSYSLASCRDGVCVYQREGTCQAGGTEYEINNVLKRNGQ